MNKSLKIINQARKNTDPSKLNEIQRSHLYNLEHKLRFLSEKDLLDNKDYTLDLLKDLFEIKGEGDKIYLNPLTACDIPISKSHLVQFRDQLGTHKYSNAKIPHNYTIIGMYIDDKKEMKLLLSHYTTTNKDFTIVIKNTKLNTSIDKNHLISLYHAQEPQIIEYMRINKIKFKDLISSFDNERTNNTWMYGENGTLPLINLGLLPDGRTQFCSDTMIVIGLKDLNKYYDLSHKDFPSLLLQLEAQSKLFIKSDIEVFDPITGTYSIINLNNIYPLKLNYLYETIKDKDNIIDLETIICEATDLPKSEILKKLGRLIEINPYTGEIIHELKPKRNFDVWEKYFSQYNIYIKFEYNSAGVVTNVYKADSPELLNQKILAAKLVNKLVNKPLTPEIISGVTGKPNNKQLRLLDSQAQQFRQDNNKESIYPSIEEPPFN